MSTNYITGYSYPKFKIYSSTNVEIDEIVFPFVDSNGMVETITRQQLIHELNDGVVLTKVLGDKLSWSFSYMDFASKSFMLDLQKLFRYEKGGNILMFYPRSDDTTRYFEVYYSGESFNWTLIKAIIDTKGMKLVQLQYSTVDYVDDWKFKDPDTIPKIIFTEPFIFSIG